LCQGSWENRWVKNQNAFADGTRVAVADFNGNQWWIATHVEDVSEDELAKRATAAKAKH
jgi:hypothetical protein